MLQQKNSLSLGYAGWQCPPLRLLDHQKLRLLFNRQDLNYDWRILTILVELLSLFVAAYVSPLCRTFWQLFRLSVISFSAIIEVNHHSIIDCSCSTGVKQTSHDPVVEGSIPVGRCFFLLTIWNIWKRQKESSTQESSFSIITGDTWCTPAGP